jgi:3,4-dihydroxy 2-butanone 4-phosphate synthase/GTP cyclohydrolase II
MPSASRLIAGTSAILADLGIKRVRLLSNNPHKASALAANGLEVVGPLPCEAAPNPHSLAYLQTKKERMGHALSLRQAQGTAQHAVRGHPTATAVPGLIGSITTERPNSPSESAALRRRARRTGGKRWMRLLPNNPKASFAFN